MMRRCLICRQQEAHLVEFGLSYARNTLSCVPGGISTTLESWWCSTRAWFLKVLEAKKTSCTSMSRDASLIIEPVAIRPAQPIRGNRGSPRGCELSLDSPPISERDAAWPTVQNSTFIAPCARAVNHA